MAFSDPGKGRITEQGEGLVKITLAEACKAGDVLGYSSGWKRALALGFNLLVPHGLYSRLYCRSPFLGNQIYPQPTG